EQVLGDASLSKPKATSSGSRKKPVAASAGPKTPPKQEAAPDVFDFAFDGDNVDIAGEIAQPKSGTKAKPGSKSKKPATPPAGSGPRDSGSDVKLIAASDEVNLGGPGPGAATDSNVRLDKVALPPADSSEGGMMLTEEINLDEEIAKQQEKDKDKPPTKLKAK